jgi:hypothetical protein
LFNAKISLESPSEKHWIASSNSSFHHNSLLEAYTLALKLLPQIAWLGLSMTDCHHHLLNSSNIIWNAVAAAIDAKQPNKAIEWLAQGQSIIWGQVLQLWTPLDHLRKAHPKLAERLDYLSSYL